MKVIFLVFAVISAVTANNSVLIHPKIVEISGDFGNSYNNTLSIDTQFVYWISGENNAASELTVKVQSSVGNQATLIHPVRFEVQWVEHIQQPSRSWLLPVQDLQNNGY